MPVPIILPNGTPGTVADEDLPQALAAGAKVSGGSASSQDDGGLLGGLAAGILGAGSTVTLGATDRAAQNISRVIGGDDFAREVTTNLRDVRERNPMATTAGELGGMFLAPEALGTVGEAAGGLVQGEGLAAAMARSSARFAAESALIGAQQKTTEDALHDHQYNAEAVFAQAGKDALLGAVAGAPLGALGYGAGKALGKVGGLFRSRSGPIADAALDEVASVEGAGRGLLEDARKAETAIDDVRKTGATAEQAAGAVSELGTLGKAAPEAGIGRGLIDDAAERYAAAHGGERGSMLKGHYEDMASRAIDADLAADSRARKLADAGTKVMRLEDTLNQVNFTERPDQFSRLLDPAKYGTARDVLAAMGQDVRAAIGELEVLPTRSLGPSRIGKTLQEAELAMSHLPADASAGALKDAWSAQYRVKQAVGKFAGFGKPPHLRSPEENALGELYERLRVGFEDPEAFGAAGDANREWNEAFSDKFGRRKDYGSRFSVSIDQGPGGAPLPELDAGKVKGFLGQLGGAESDQAVKSTQAMIDWERQRIAAIEKHGLLTDAQKTAISEGRAAVDAFEKEFQTAAKEAEAANRVRQAKLDEGNGLGGVLGLLADTVTRPATTVERLARLAQTVEHVEDGIRSGLRKIGKGSTGEAAAQRAPRPREKIIEDIENVRALASNPAALETAAQRMVGDLSNYAPKIANELRLTAMRTLLYLAREAPPASTTETGMFNKPTPRYSDIQLHDWDRKATAALDARTLATDVKSGRLNRDAIEAAKFGSPKLFGRLQELAKDELLNMQKDGTLGRMSYQDKASFATLLEVAPDQTWTGEFMAMIQDSKATPPPPTGDASKPVDGSRLPAKSNQKPTGDMFATDAQNIAAGGNVR